MTDFDIIFERDWGKYSIFRKNNLNLTTFKKGN